MKNLLFIAIFIVLSGCGMRKMLFPYTPESILPEQIQVACSNSVFDVLSVGSRLRITIYGHEDISREVDIGPQGMVVIPMIGEVKAEGETTQSLAQNINSKADSANLISTGVEVEIVKYPPIYVTGLVGASGAYDYKPRINVRQAVALAGGFSPRARTSEVRILRMNSCTQKVEEITGDLDTEILPSDTIEVLRRWF